MQKYFLSLMLFVHIAFSAELTGVIRNAESSSPLQNVNIKILFSSFGCATNRHGEFEIAGLPNGEYTIRVTSLGFEAQEILLDIQGNRNMEILLQPKVLGINRDIIVTANRKEETSFTEPKSLVMLDESELNRRMPRSMAEALVQTTGVWMQKTNHGGGSPFIRGMTGNQALILIDGVRLNNATFRYGPNQYLNTIDPWQVERIEVVRGAGSVTHGSDALGGVINIITKNPHFSSDGLKCSSRVYSKFMSSNMEQSGRIELGLSTSQLALLGGFSIKDFGDIKAGGDLGIESPSSYNENNFDLKAKIKLSWRSTLTVAIQNVYQNDVTRFDQVAQRGYAYYMFDPQIRRLGYARWSLFSKKKWIRSVNVTGSFHKSIEQRKKQKESAMTKIVERDEVNTFGLSVEINSEISQNWSALSGIDLYQDKVGSWKKSYNLSHNSVERKRGLFADGAEATSFAIFTQHRYNLNTVGIEFGGRFNGYQLSIQDAAFGDVATNPESVVGNAGLIYSANSNNNIFISVSQAFRAPNINDVSSLGDFDFGVEVPSAGLSSEKSLNYEAGLKSNYGNWTSAFAVYRTNLYDLISRVRSEFQGSSVYEDQNVYRKQNVAHAYIQGFESDVEFSIAKLFAFYGALIYTFGENESANEPMRRIPPLNGKAGVRFLHKAWWADAVFMFAVKQDRLSAGDKDDHRIPDGGTPGWQVVNINGGYDFGFVSIYVGLANLFNEAYRLHGSGIDGYGRSFWIGVNVGI